MTKQPYSPKRYSATYVEFNYQGDKEVTGRDFDSLTDARQFLMRHACSLTGAPSIIDRETKQEIYNEQ